MYDPIPIPTPTPRPTAEPGAYPTFELEMNYVNLQLGNEAIQGWRVLPGEQLQASALVIVFFFCLAIVIIKFRATFGGDK